MKIDDIVNTVEKYLREFILYLLAFFWNGKPGDDPDPVTNILNNNVTFAVLSSAVGSYIWGITISAPSKDLKIISDLGHTVASSLINWIALGLFLYALLHFLRIKIHILLPVIAVMRIFAVSHVISIFFGYLVVCIVKFCAQEAHIPAATEFFLMISSYSMELFLIYAFAPREFLQLIPNFPKRRIFSMAVFFVLVFIIIATPLAVWLVKTAGIYKNELFRGNVIQVLAITSLMYAAISVWLFERSIAHSHRQADANPEEGS